MPVELLSQVVVVRNCHIVEDIRGPAGGVEREKALVAVDMTNPVATVRDDDQDVAGMIFRAVIEYEHDQGVAVHREDQNEVARMGHPTSM